MFTHQDLISHTDKLRRFSLKLTRNQAHSDDLLQSTLLRALEKSDLYKDDSNLLGWTGRIMFNIFISDRRKDSRMEYGMEPEEYGSRLTSRPNQLDKLELMELQEMMLKLPAAQQEVLRLICFDELTYEEAAKQIGVPVGTIRSRLARARGSLAELMENDEVLTVN